MRLGSLGSKEDLRPSGLGFKVLGLGNRGCGCAKNPAGPPSTLNLSRKVMPDALSPYKQNFMAV